MADYGHDLLFGTVLTPWARAPGVVELAQLTERVGLDLVSVADHPYQPAFLDAWTLLSVIASRTSRVRVLPNVANLPLRPPAMLARAAASLEVLPRSGGTRARGRRVLGCDRCRGRPRRTPAESVAALCEAIEVVRALWTPGGLVWSDGKHYGLDGVEPGPFPAHDIGIWVGAIGPRMLRLIGSIADGWLPSSPRVPPDRLAAGNRIIDEAATAAGRSPQAVRRLYNIAGGLLDGRQGCGRIGSPSYPSYTA